MGVSIETDKKNLVIYRKDGLSKNNKAYTIYSTKFSAKDQNGDWHTAFVNVNFPKGTEIANKSEIKITKGFIGVDSLGEKVKLVVTEFEIVKDATPVEPVNENGVPLWLVGSDDDDDKPPFI